MQAKTDPHPGVELTWVLIWLLQCEQVTSTGDCP